jgi:hypothetical protein
MDCTFSKIFQFTRRSRLDIFYHFRLFVSFSRAERNACRLVFSQYSMLSNDPRQLVLRLLVAQFLFIAFFAVGYSIRSGRWVSRCFVRRFLALRSLEYQISRESTVKELARCGRHEPSSPFFSFPLARFSTVTNFQTLVRHVMAHVTAESPSPMRV